MKNHRRALLYFVLIVLLLLGATGLWLRAQQRQYARNRQLIAALAKDDMKQALALVEAGADPNTRCYSTSAPTLSELLKQFLHHTPLPVDHSPSAFLVACGASVPTTPGNHIFWFLWEENLPLVQAMLAHGANVYVRESDTPSALHDAVASGRLHTAELLLQHGANVNTQDADGRTALMFIGNSNVEMAHLLFSYGANPNLQEKHGYSPLAFAINMDDSVAFISELLAHGADPNLPIQNGYTPLMLAKQAKRPDLVTLLRHGGK